jgi:hypothetical protein
VPPWAGSTTTSQRSSLSAEYTDATAYRPSGETMGRDHWTSRKASCASRKPGAGEGEAEGDGEPEGDGDGDGAAASAGRAGPANAALAQAGREVVRS